MRVKLDEDLPRAAVFLLRSAGEDAQTVHEQGMNGWQDPDLWRAVQTEGPFLITGDKGFADLRSYPPGSHCGVLLLRPDRDGVGPLVDLLKNPCCVGEARRLVLDQLSRHYQRPFADQWEFVDYVHQRKLELDLTTPPKRP